MVGIVLSAGCHIGRQSVDVVLILVGICRLQFSQFTVQKKNILILPKTAAGVLPPVILTGICFFLLSFLLMGKFCPIRGEDSSPSIGQNLPYSTGRKLHLIGQLQENTVCPVPALPDADSSSRILQLGQCSLDRPLAPVQVVRHLPDWNQ